ncbi:hypothetical protein ECE50_010640 [Chitinophaga sp. Mgbs1]|uniref:Uncharacterized protein n=1 Tax=Chitinophaga solisilvae TaxID=1233460 RepID=A0A9Q5GT10_9BACT|nr:hypothetical protein [Chitinophaga solisilvae]
MIPSQILTSVVSQLPCHETLLTPFTRLLPFIPASAMAYAGFEAACETDFGNYDFAFNISREGVEHMSRDQQLPWIRLKTFLRLWQSSPYFHSSENGAVWLEFDTADKNFNPLHDPNVFFGFPISADQGFSDFCWLTSSLLPVLTGGPVSPQLMQQLAVCFEQCPPHTRRIQAGLMIARPVTALRLCFFQIQAADVLPLLGKINWPGDVGQVALLLEKYACYTDSLCIHLDIGETIYPTLGIELLFDQANPWHWQPAFEPRWQHIFTQLKADNYITQENYHFLMAWPRQTTHQSSIVEKLLASLDTSLPSPATTDYTLTQGIQHIKFKLSPRKISVKSYFGCCSYYVEND